MKHTGLLAVGSMFIVVAAASDACAQTDWDLYALRLMNRARSNPSAEAGIIGSTIEDDSPPVPPLALHPVVSLAARNHVHWMHDNFGSLPLSTFFVPDSWTLFETLDGWEDGPPAVGTPSYTGVEARHRMSWGGFTSGPFAETSIAIWSADAIEIDAAFVESQHLLYWELFLFNDAMLDVRLTVYGQHLENRAFEPPRGGLEAPNDNLFYSDILIATPHASLPQDYILGLLYDDLDESGGWTPRNDSDANREGLGGVSFVVYTAGTVSEVASDTTMDNGAFAVNVVDGAYDLHLLLPSTTLVVPNVVVAGANVDVGDIRLLGANELIASCLRGPASVPDPMRLGYAAQHCITAYDDDGDSDVDIEDYAAFARRAGTPPVPGDFDGDGDVDGDDLLVFCDCLGGPAQAPAPSLPGVTVQKCLDAFDADDGGRVDMRDYASIASNAAL